MLGSVAVAYRIWIGLDDLAVEGEFRWGSGALLDWSRWRTSSGQPNNGGGDEDCAAAIPYNDMKWADDPCFDTELIHGLICQHLPGQ